MINPYILLAIGIFFALLYASVIIVGWSITRRGRNVLRSEVGTTQIPLINLESDTVLSSTMTSISISANKFTDAAGKPLNPTDFDAYIVGSTSPTYPAIARGDLIFCAIGTTTPLHAFTLPNPRLYR